MTACCVHSDRPAVKGRRYCERCIDRLRHGWDCLDYDDLPDRHEIKRAKSAGTARDWAPMQAIDVHRRG